MQKKYFYVFYKNKNKLSIKQRQKDKPTKRQTYIQTLGCRHRDKEAQEEKC